MWQRIYTRLRLEAFQKGKARELHKMGGGERNVLIGSQSIYGIIPNKALLQYLY